MPASVSVRNHGASYARNNGASYRTRAAVLCFGGWGLQTMLHLWPRIRLIQEEREVLGIDRELPNLDRLTAFAAILPETGPASGTLAIPPFHVLQPNFERYPAPFYLQRQLASIETEVAEAPDPRLTHAERVGAHLLERVREDGYVRPLSVSFSQPSNGGAGQLPASRAETFRAGIGAAGATVRALLSQVIDPTRLDSMQTRDPFVQTTIYVIAPLSEPRASALVWPVVSELVGTLRRRHVARVIAFFSTASFAPDDGRAIEEATVHMSLRELEALSDPSARDDGSGGLSRLVVECGGAVWGERMGRRLFDMAYLIDREKSNQALAESALELSTLVGNTIEAFLAADGLGHIEKSLGPDTVARSTGHPMTGRPTYSVLGAACDHVPLAEHIASAIEEEQKQAMRATVLAAADRPVSVEADLRALGAAPDALIRRFLAASGRPMFEPAAGRPSPGWPPELRVTEGFTLPKALANELRRTKDPLRWRELLESRAVEASAEVEGVHAATGGDAGSIPKAVELAAEQVVADLCSAPDGILLARARLSSWLGAVGSLLGDLQRKTGDRDGGEPYRTRLDAWQREYANAAETYQQTVALWVRIVALACFGALALAGAMLLLRGSELGREGRIALLVGFAVILAALGIVAWFAATGRMRRLKRQRIDLLEERLSREASQMLCRGLFDAYSRLYEELTGLQVAVESAFKELLDWTEAQPASQEAASEAGGVPIRAALADEGLWEAVRKHVRRENADGERSHKRLQELWRADGNASREWLPQGSKLAQGLTAALDGRRRARGDTPSMSRSTGHSIAEIYREYAARATEYLCPTQRLYADHPALVQEVVSSSTVEGLLLSDPRHEPAGAGDHSGAEVVEDICVRAKPAAGFEVTYLLSSDVLEVEFGVAAEGPASPLQRAFEQRSMPLLTSKDPLTLSVVRTVNRLSLSELILTERCRDEFVRLSRSDRAMLSFLAADQSSEGAALYGEREEPVTLERQAARAVARR